MAPVNDNFENRIPLDLTSQFFGTNIGATYQAGEPIHTASFAPEFVNSVWYSFTAPTAGTYVLDTFGSSYDTTLTVYTGNAVNSLNLVTGNDDASFAFDIGNGLWSVVDVNAGAGQTYQVAVDGFSSVVGDFTLTLSQLVSGTAGDDILPGTNRNETFRAGSGNDSVGGNGGNDRIFGEDGNDLLVGSGGNDVIVGGNGNDGIFGNGGSDRLSGGDGNDRVFGASGSDFITGGEGNDTLYGNGGLDTIQDFAGDNIIFGGSQRDVITTGFGNDTIYGSGGNDLISSGSGFDVIQLASGAADVVLSVFGSGFDTIQSFQVGQTRLLTGGIGGLSVADSSAGAQISFNGNLIAVVSGVSASDAQSSLV